MVSKSILPIICILSILSTRCSMAILSVTLLMAIFKRLTTISARIGSFGSRENAWTTDKPSCHYNGLSSAIHETPWKLQVPNHLLTEIILGDCSPCGHQQVVCYLKRNSFLEMALIHYVMIIE